VIFMLAIQNRYEFVYLFDVTNGNPNGDPDAGNQPRLEPDSGKGLVTDVCLKRKVRNYVQMAKLGSPPHAIYVQERAILNSQHQKAYEALGIKLEAKKLPKDEAKARELTAWMCANFFDIRTFGAVMTTDVNCGQVRGPVQLSIAQSIDPIVPLEITITRSSVTNERDAEKERTMGRKHIVPYGLYRAHGFISAHLAERTGFCEDDLQLFWEALGQMFEHDRSATRGEMTSRRLIVFRHHSKLGNAPAHRLFETVKVRRAAGAGADQSLHPSRAFGDYVVHIHRDAVPPGVELVEPIST
jgi:CRISPR-associated protein Csd2